MKNRMKNNSIYKITFRWVIAIMALWIPYFGMNTVSAQAVLVGDLLTFADGSQGIVCYVDPTNNQKGWAIDLYDLNNTTYRIYTSNSVLSTPTMVNRESSVISVASLSSWTYEGKANTAALYKMKNSPAANAAKPESGWYIPDAYQMLTISGMVPVLTKAFTKAGVGNINNIVQRDRAYWTSSRSSISSFYYLTTSGYLTTTSPNTSYYIRRVRDFDRGNEPHAFWVDEPKKDSIWVKPEVTTSYDALVVYLTDTFEISSSVIVHSTYDKDTIYGDTLYVDHAFDYQLHNVTFHVTGPGVMTKYDTLKTEFGCDSIQTVILIIETVHYDTLTCTIEPNGYKWQDIYDLPADTNELGLYEFPGTKIINNYEIDTVSYLKLIVDLEYEYFDTVDICMYESTTVLTYDKVTEVTITATESGLTLTSSSSAVVITEGAQAGDYILWMKSVDGCDSLVQLHIDYNPVKRDTVFGDTIYEGVTFNKTLANHTFTVTEGGMMTYNDTLKSTNGCDSIVYIFLRVEVPFFDTVCQSQINIPYADPYNVVSAGLFSQNTLDSLVRASGRLYTEKIVLQDVDGRDSIVKFSLLVTPWIMRDTSVTVTNWQGGGYNWHDSLYTEPGSHAVYTQASDGCDFLDVLHLVILDIDTSDNEICLGDSSNLKVSVTKREMTAYSELIPYVPYIGDVLCTDGTVLGVDSFLNSSKTAKGVVFYVDEEEGYGRAIALSNAYSNSSMLWSSNRVQYLTTTFTTYSQVSQDMNGKANTTKMMSKYSNTASYVPAAHHCYYYNHTTYGTGTQSQGWYLPAAGEMILIYGNRVELNKTLDKLRTQNTNNTLLYNNTYWTSSEYNNNYSWYFLNTGNLNYTYKNNNYYYARPVIKFPLP